MPATANAAWTGNYVFSSLSPSVNNSAPCTANISGAFTATPVGDATGTYTGSGSFSTFGTLPNPASVPVTMSLVLQQGATLYGLHSGEAVASRLALSGSVQSTGLTCFSQGLTSTVADSLVEGNRIQASFVTEDGSTAILLGEILDVAATRLSIDTIQVRGQCNAIYDFFQNPLIVQR